MSMHTHALIAGAGMVGLATACALAKQNLSVTVVEKFSTKLDAADKHPLRVSAINTQSQKLLADIGAWQRIDARQLSPFDAMHVWDENTSAQLDFDAGDIGTSQLGHIMPNAEIVKALWAQALALGVEILAPEEITEFDTQSDSVTVTLASGKTITTELLLACEGRRSPLREQAGITIEQASYGQRGLVCVVKTEKPHNRTAYQRFCETGPLAFLPLKDEHECSIVWSQPDADAQATTELSEKDFNTALEQAFESKLGKVKVLSQRASFPLGWQYATTYIAPRFALLGDAAHGIHPLAGQGVNLGFADVVALVDAIAWAQNKKRPWAGMATLQRYERERAGHNKIVMQSMTGLNALFSNTQPGLMGLRHLGVNLVNDHAWLKRFFMKRAAG
jgi:2-octaprenylphenol hydroxylase